MFVNVEMNPLHQRKTALPMKRMSSCESYLPFPLDSPPPQLMYVGCDSYDTHGVFSSPRALYMFRAFGHHRSSILDGGLPGWQAHGGNTRSGDARPVRSGPYRATATLKEGIVKGEGLTIRLSPPLDH